MKKIYIIIVLMLILSLFGCSQKNNDSLKDFIINGSSSIGATIDDLDNFDEQKYSFSYSITSQTGKLNEVDDIIPVIGENYIDRIITNEPVKIEHKEDYIEIQGNVVFSSKGLTKEQIVEFGQVIPTFKIITKDNIEYTIGLNEY